MAKVVSTLMSLDMFVFRHVVNKRSLRASDNELHSAVANCRRSRFPLFQFMLRCVCAAALLSWVHVVQYGTDCGQLDPGNGWTCAWVTHPLFESPACDCRIVVGNVQRPSG